MAEAIATRAVPSLAGPALGLAALRIEAKAPRADLVGEPSDLRALALARALVGALGPRGGAGDRARPGVGALGPGRYTAVYCCAVEGEALGEH